MKYLKLFFLLISFANLTQAAHIDLSSEKFILEAEELINAYKNPNLALVIAIRDPKISTETIKILVSNFHAHVNYTDLQFITPMHWLATTNKLPDLIDFFIANGALIDPQDFYGYTPSFIAIKSKKIDSALALINKGANVNLRYYPLGSTLLHYAASKRMRSVVKALIAHGANPSAIDYYGFKPKNYALSVDTSDPESYIQADPESNREILETPSIGHGFTPLLD